MNEEDKPDTTPAPEPEEEEQEAQEIDEVTLLKEQLEEALREKEQFRSMAQRAQADLMNYRRRSAEEMEELGRSASSQWLLKILSILDDLERALAHIPEDAVAPGWLDGLLLVQRNINSILESEGVSKIEAADKPFEPWEFEAVHYEETQEAEDGRVIEVLREGYKVHDRVLRPAQVVVAKQPEPQDKIETTEEEDQ